MTQLVSAAAMLVAGVALGADNWPQFRGPNGSGTSGDSRPGPVEFGPGKNQLWKTPLPPGHSSPCIWGDRIFLTTCDVPAKKLETICLDRRDGKILWRDAVTVEALEDVHKTSSHAAATPACDGERVYSVFGSYGLIAYSIDGKKAWEMRLPMPTVRFGSASSPVVVNGRVIVNRQQTFGQFNAREKAKAESELLAVESTTGRVAWQTPLPKSFAGVGHPTPCVTGDVVVIAGGGKVAAFDVKTGAARWHADGLPPVATATPVADADRLYVNLTGLAGDIDRVEAVPYDTALKQWDKNGDGKLQRGEIPDELAVFTRRRDDHEGDFGLKQWFFQRADGDRDGALARNEWDSVWGKTADFMVTAMKPALAAVRLGGADNVTQSHVTWKVHRGVPEVPSLLVHAGRVYAVRNGGVVSCFDAASGKVHFEERLGPSGSYYASPVTDGTHVYFVSQPGVVTVIKAGDTFERLAMNDLGEPVAATPAIVGGSLFVRTELRLYRFAMSP